MPDATTEDVYRLLALLGDLERALHPLAEAAPAELGVQPSIPCPLPPTGVAGPAAAGPGQARPGGGVPPAARSAAEWLQRPAALPPRPPATTGAMALTPWVEPAPAGEAAGGTAGGGPAAAPHAARRGAAEPARDDGRTARRQDGPGVPVTAAPDAPGEPPQPGRRPAAAGNGRPGAAGPGDDRGGTGVAAPRPGGIPAAVGAMALPATPAPGRTPDREPAPPPAAAEPAVPTRSEPGPVPAVPVRPPPPAVPAPARRPGPAAGTDQAGVWPSQPVAGSGAAEPLPATRLRAPAAPAGDDPTSPDLPGGQMAAPAHGRLAPPAPAPPPPIPGPAVRDGGTQRRRRDGGGDLIEIDLRHHGDAIRTPAGTPAASRPGTAADPLPPEVDDEPDGEPDGSATGRASGRGPAARRRRGRMVGEILPADASNMEARLRRRFLDRSLRRLR